MHSPLMDRLLRPTALSLTLAVWAAVLPAQSTPVGGNAGANATAVLRAEALLREGRRADAKLLLGQHLATAPNDGRAWFALGRIQLGDAQAWHREGHPTEGSGIPLIEFATSAFDQAHHLMADSASVYLVLAIVERTTSRIERLGWTTAMESAVAPEEVPLPPVLRELGRNLMGSCPAGGVLVTGSLVETAAVWGVRLAADGHDDGLVLIRPDLYAFDTEYRGQMATAIGADPELALPAALVRASARRPVCLTPTVDSITSAALDWHPVRLVLAAGRIATGETPRDLSVHLLARTGLAGSVLSEAARDVYDLAARRNRTLCQSLFARSDAQGLPAIAACLP
jgi:hypothetical protein